MWASAVVGLICYIHSEMLYLLITVIQSGYLSDCMLPVIKALLTLTECSNVLHRSHSWDFYAWETCSIQHQQPCQSQSDWDLIFSPVLLIGVNIFCMNLCTALLSDDCMSRCRVFLLKWPVSVWSLQSVQLFTITLRSFFILSYYL